MATYYHGNTDHLHSSGDGLQTLVLINPSYIGINSGDTQQTTRQESPTTNNHSSNNNHLVYLPHAPPHFVGIPLSRTSTSSQDLDAVGFVPSRAHYNQYNLQMDGGPTAPELPRRQQGLSLSLSSDQRGYSTRVAGASPPPRADEMMGLSSNGVVQNQVLLGSKYLRAAQELLDEVVNVGKGALEGLPDKGKSSGDGGEPSAAQSPRGGGGEGGLKRGASELSTAERQEIQMKKAKLVNMLDQVEQRYRQYHHQMQIVISWFVQVAGLGSSTAKSYTALALRTISKQFRCLKDAILNQIEAATKILGEEEPVNYKIKGSRLKYVDSQIRQQRALQQLGMVQHNAWRPQRGLPEPAVSVLRAWLFEHFLHPYPKDSDKITLAKQTGLTRSQVSNWFINARVRLWKPMVEEMYMEEMKEKGNNNIVSSSSSPPLSSDHMVKTSKSERKEDSSSKPLTSHQIPTNPLENYQPQNSTIFTANDQEDPINHNTMNVDDNPGFNLIAPSETDHSITQGNSDSSNSPTPKNLRMSPSYHQHHQFLHNSSPNINLITSMNTDSKQPTTEGIAHGFNLMGGFGSYPIAELGGRFGPEVSFHQSCNNYSGNSVSLTLGLQRSENNHNLAITASHHQGFMPNSHQGVHEIAETNDFTGMNNEAAASNNAHSTSVYESINIQDRKRFVAQLLPDFVA